MRKKLRVEVEAERIWLYRLASRECVYGLFACESVLEARGLSSSQARSASHPLSRGCFLERECSKFKLLISIWNMNFGSNFNVMLKTKSTFSGETVQIFETPPSNLETVDV